MDYNLLDNYNRGQARPAINAAISGLSGYTNIVNQICLTTPERFKDASDSKNVVKFLVKLFCQVATAQVTWRNRTHYIC